MAKTGKQSGVKILVIILILLIICAGVLLALKVLNTPKTEETQNQNVDEPQPQVVEEEKPITIYQGDDRPIAVMIDNHDGARPQAGLNDAYIVYEIIVEGGYTRLMPVYKGVDLDKIGPIRSARHYFIDYALENDAIYVHYGWSPQAQSDISKYDVDNINGIFESASNLWRVNDKYAPHNVVTTTEKILEIAERKEFKTVSNKESVLNYVSDEVLLEDGQGAIEVVIPYSTSEEVSFEYNEKTKKYEKYANGEKQEDWGTDEVVAAKNIIITFADNYTLNGGSGKGRQDLENVGTCDGYYITNGKAIKIKCEKSSRTAQTVYKDLNGEEIEVNDGNTFIQICPIDADVEIIAPETESTSTNTTNN